MRYRMRLPLTGAVILGTVISLSTIGVYFARATFWLTSSPADFTPAIITHSRSIIDEVGTLSFTADEAYYTDIRSFTITFSGSALSNSTPSFSVWLKSMTGTTTQTCTPDITASCTVTFTPNPSYSLSAGKTKNVKVRIDSSNFYDAAGINETLNISINNAADLLWSDGVTDNIPLETPVVPLLIASIRYI